MYIDISLVPRPVRKIGDEGLVSTGRIQKAAEILLQFAAYVWRIQFPSYGSKVELCMKSQAVFRLSLQLILQARLNQP